MPPSVTILHLSDLHFGRKHRFEQEGAGTLLARVWDDLRDQIARHELRPDLVVLSGDFAEYGKRDELDRASTFVRGLRAHLNLPARRFVMVPGNHDIHWKKSEAYFADRAGDDLPAVEPYFPKFSHYQRFFESFYEGESGILFTEEEPWSFFEVPDLGVVIAGMNSAFAESHRPEDHHAFLGEAQLRAFAGKLRPYKERGYLRIGVMHHDPFDKRGGPRADQDQEDMRRWLVPELNLLLHGDIHKETLRWLDRNVPALGVGSAAVGADERGPDVSNEYQLLVIRAGGIERHLRAWVGDQKRWVVSPRADGAGESGKTFVKVDFEAVTALGRREAPAPAVDLAEIVARYRASMTRNQGAPTVFDLLRVGDGDGGSGLDFLKLFVPQEALRDVPRPERARRERWAGGLDESTGEALAEGPPMDEPRFTDGGLARSRTVDRLFDLPRLLFIGAPGAGKSALTRWLLLELCVPGERVEGLPEELVPVRIELRRFDEEHRRAGTGFTFFDHVARDQADRNGPLAAEHLRSLAEQGRILWLFDGLDEVADPGRRRDMAERIAGLLDKYKDCRSVVTSRVAGVDVARPILEGAAFQTYAIQDFTVEQRNRFLDAWHEVVFRSDPVTGAQRRGRMRAAIDTAPSLQELCKNPLLCSLLAYLHREEALPSKRHKLYQKVLERMAEHWDANKGLPERPAAERFELEDKLAFLRALALQMQSGERTSGNVIGRGELEDFAARFCENKWGQPPDTARRRAEALIHQLYARHGVLAFLGADTYGFAHRAFMELLAASEMVDRFRTRQWEERDLAAVFAERWQDVKWEETLLLTCGLLQDDGEAGCARVVRMLQGIGEGRHPHIYDKLKDYLCFCIKTLGELPHLESGVPGDFARAINDILVLQIRGVALWGGKLTEAFRRCSGRWPDVGALVAAVDKRVASNDPSYFMLDLYAAWIAAGGIATRTELVTKGFQHPRHRWMLLHGFLWEAIRLGPLSDKDITTILDASHEASERDRFYVAINFLNPVGSRCEEGAQPVRLLWEFVNVSSDQGVRLESAAALLRAGHHVNATKAILLEAARSDDPTHAVGAAVALARQGFGELVLEPLERFARKSEWPFHELLDLASRSATARATLRRVLTAIRAEKEPDILVRIAHATMHRGFSFFTEAEIHDRLRQIQDLKLKGLIIGWFRSTPGAEPLLVRAWLELLDQDSRYGNDIAWDSREMTPQQAGPLLFELWRRLLDLDRINVSMALVEPILRHSSDNELRAHAGRIRETTLHESAPEEVRLQAAQNFRHNYPPAQRVLEELAANAQDEGVRYQAARLAGNLSSLHEIANRTDSADRRRYARHALDLYGEIAALLQVGRLRKARVRLDGRDAGILEELTKVNNGTRFTYLPDYDGPPIAPNMPLGKEYKDEDTLLPFFANLLPEGALYEQTARRLGVKRNDKLGMLLRVGADTMGAVEVLPLEPA